jgi:chemotaxis protein methyltransferase CheR
MLSDAGFHAVTDFFYERAGIRLNDAKKQLVAGRLSRRATQLGHATLDDYVRSVLRAPLDAEADLLTDALTTNETYFFRESAHFEHLAGLARTAARPLRVWSAASSSGEEAYSIAMVLARHARQPGWEIVGTDLSTKVVALAQRGLYPADRCRHVAPDDLKRWCLKGQGEFEGQVLISPDLRKRVRFLAGNLTEPMTSIGLFDVVFLRNVLIYFDGPMRKRVVEVAVAQLREGGVLYTGHAESIQGVLPCLQQQAPAIHVKTA